MVRELHDLTELYTWTRPRDAGGSADHRPVGHQLGRSGPPLRRAAPGPAAAPTRVSPTAAARGHLAARGAAGVQPGADQSVPPRGVRPPLDPVRRPAAPRSQHPAARLARSAAAEHAPRPRASASQEGGRQRPVPGLPQPVQQPRLRHGGVRRARPLPHRRRRCSTNRPARWWRRCPSTPAASRRWSLGDTRAGDGAGRAQPAHRRQRQGRGLPVGQLLPLRLAPRSDRPTAPTPARTRRRAASLAVRADRWRPRSGVSPQRRFPSTQGGRAMNRQSDEADSRRALPQGRGRARRWRCRFSSRWRRGGPPGRPPRRPSA